MPKNAISYKKTVIYKIQHIELPNLLYVGHTTDFIKRKNQHKTASRNITNHQKIYGMMRQNGGWDKFEMNIIKEFPCNSRSEAEVEEYKIMNELQATMNKIMNELQATMNKKILISDNNKRMWKYCDVKTMECKLCNFSCDKKSLWNKHIYSEKHIHIFTIVDNIQNEYDKLFDENQELKEEIEDFKKSLP